MKFGVYPELTIRYILDRVEQEKIFEFYLNITVDFDENIISPFRGERTPSAGFYRDRHGKVRLNDQGGDFHGDCFDAASKITGISTNSKKGFKLLLHTIAKDFRIHQYKNADAVKEFYKLTHKFTNLVNQRRRKTIIRVKARNFNAEDWKFWGNIATEPLLKHFQVYAIDEAYMQKGEFPMFKLYNYHYKEPCYGYYFGKNKEGEEQWRLYFPFNKEKKFITNSYLLQGEQQIEISKFGIVTKSYKDVIALRSFGINAVAPSSEKTILNSSQVAIVKKYYGFVWTMMDYDEQGIRNMVNHRRTYGLNPILLTDSIHNRKGGYKGCKDFTDIVNKFGRSTVKSLIKEEFNKHKDGIEEYYKLERNLLKQLIQ